MGKNRFELSKFVHLLDLQGGNFRILYNALTMSLVVVKSKLANTIKSGDFSKIHTITLRKLESAKIIQRKGHNSSDLETARSFFSKQILGVLCLMLTEACNIRCRYCFVMHKFPARHRFKSMTKETAKQGIDVFVRHLPVSLKEGLKAPTISFYGGEPLLNLPVLSYALDYIARLKDKSKIPEETMLTLNTNGTLITKKVALLLKKYKVAASVSLDGLQVVHNEARRDRLGRETFDSVIRGISFLRDCGVDVGISCAVAMHNIDRLEESAAFFMDKIGVDVFGFNVLVDGGLPEPGFELASYANKVADKITNCFLLARNKGKQEERSFRLAKSFADGVIHHYDCCACGQQLVVDPKGRFGPCHAYLHSSKNFFAGIDDFDVFAHPLWREWRKRSPLNMAQCQNCVALAICGGGCPYNAEERQGSIWEVDEAFCPFAQSMTKLLIGEVAQKAISEHY